MPKATPDEILDAMADTVIAQVTTHYVTSAEPADYAGLAAVALADVAFTGADIAKSDGDTSGRKFTMAQKTSFAVDARRALHNTHPAPRALCASRQPVTKQGFNGVNARVRARSGG